MAMPGVPAHSARADAGVRLGEDAVAELIGTPFHVPFQSVASAVIGSRNALRTVSWLVFVAAAP